jgi:hypothetical protein
MAKIEGTQNVPSALLDAYRGTLGEATPKASVAKRYPYRIPPMQTETGHPSVKQLAQRSRFKESLDNFANVDPSTRARWFDAMPPWGSFLWYYNYFIMSSLVGNADIPAGGAGVIKSLQHKTISMPAGSGEGQVAITAVDIAKTVVMLWGNSFWLYETGDYATTGNVYPYLSSLTSTLVKCKWAVSGYGGNSTQAATISVIVIEYI